VLQEGIEDSQQFVHAGRQGELLGLSRREQARVQGFQNWIRSSTHQRGHIQRRPDRTASTPDGTLAAEGATVTIEWSQANERADLLAANDPELG